MRFKKLLHMVCLSGFLLGNHLVSGQEEVISIINEILDDQQQNTTSELNGEELYNDLMKVYHNPILINSAAREELEQLVFLTDYQIENLLYYLYTSGAMVSLYELKAVEGWDQKTIRWFLPFIRLNEVETEASEIRVRNQLMSRFSYIPELQKGFQLDSGNHYLGSRSAILLRFDGDISNKVSWHILSEKDRGEEQLYDFIGVSVQYQGKGLIRKVVVGDYKVRTGQGLLSWSGNAFGKTMDVGQQRRKGETLSMYTSARESGFYRGAGVNLRHNSLDLTLWASKIPIDGATDVLDDEFFIRSVSEDGLHNTPTRIENKAIAHLSSAGAHLSWNNKWIKPGLTYLYQPLDIPLIKISDESFALIPELDQLHNYSFDFFTSLQHMHLWGEGALQSHGSYAGILGLDIFPHDAIQANLVYRNYSPDFYSLYGSSFGESGDPGNEKGLMLGLKVIPHGKWIINGALDLYSFPWLKYQQSFLSQGFEAYGKVSYSYSRYGQLYTQIRFEERDRTYHSETQPMDEIGREKRMRCRINLDHRFEGGISITSRMEFSTYQLSGFENGFLLLQDVIYQSEFPLSGNIRFAWFNTTDYNARLYAYERDVLYAFYVPAYYGNGLRTYLNLKYEPLRDVELWLRLARTIYSDRETIGSGLDEIQANHKSELKVQLRLKF